ncbi:MAG TPA: type 1 glutamine amidotransferase [Phycisphaerae bacterium]|nr:type 1 glutamine amidotransferase [Phycisphaerae bacterium]
MIENYSNGDGGRVAEAMQRQGADCTAVKSYETTTLPDVRAFDAVAVFGSPASCRDLAEHPALVRVAESMRQCIEIDKPILGICFGAQLLAHVLGAEVRRNDPPEYGGYEISLTPGGAGSPFFAGFPESFMGAQWHEDTFDLPAGATWLATSATCRHQAFAFGRQIGTQFHIEATREKVTRWVREYPHLLPGIGKTAEQAMDELKESLHQQEALCELFVGNFLRTVG